MKYALITGATGGLGGAGAREMAKQGWKVFACGTNDAALEELGTIENIIPLKLDITDQENIDETVKKVREVTSVLDAVVNFSGIQRMASLVEGDVALIEKMIDINVMGMIRVNKAFAPFLEDGKGRIINCSSECGWMTPQPFNGPYTLTKYAVEAYNDSLRRELMFRDIKVIKIQPGSFKTKMHDDAEAAFDRMVKSVKNPASLKVLSKMKPMMSIELKMANDPKYLVEALLKAVNSEHPKQRYRVKNSPLLGIVEIMPPQLVDTIYKKFIG